MNAVEQQFPCRVGDRVTHRRWTVDVRAAARRAGMPEARMADEVAQMAQYFPRWLLTVAVGRELHRCRTCQAVLVFDDGLRCVECQHADKTAPPAARVAWFGVMPPVGIDGLPQVKASLSRGAPAHHVMGTREGLGVFLLVPLVAAYPPGFPATPVDVSYLREFSQLAPTEQVSHTFHMLGQGRMCLFAPGEWYPAMTAREVLQQRGYPHLIKFLNYANGKRDAFAKVS
jgi:hypothetical protein